MQNKIGKEYEGIVSGITAFGMFVELENTVEGLIKFEDLGNEYFRYNDENKTLIGENSKKIYKIGDKIKEIRLEKGISQQDLAAKCNFEKANMSRIEAGRTNLTIKNAYKISLALGLSLIHI